MSDQKRGSSNPAHDNSSSNPPKTQQQANNPNSDPNLNPVSNPDSLTSRIQKSASGLAKNAFTSSAPSPDAALLSDSGKAAPSSSGSASALAAAEQYRDTTGSSSSAASRDTAGHAPPEAFRSSAATQPGGFEIPGLTEDEFQRSYGGGLSDSIGDLDMGKGKGRSVQPKLDPRSGLQLGQESMPGSTLPAHQTGATAPTAPTIQPTDGEEVVSLLSSRAFDPEFRTAENEAPEAEPIETDLSSSNPPLTPSEIQVIESFRRKLPPSETTANASQSTRALNPLSLVPDIGSFLDSMPNSAATDATALRDEVLTSLPGAENWVSVEERYQDEVWGFLKPTLEAAAKEIEEGRSKNEGGNGGEDGPAVRRLKMILRHMQH